MSYSTRNDRINTDPETRLLMSVRVAHAKRNLSRQVFAPANAQVSKCSHAKLTGDVGGDDDGGGEMIIMIIAQYRRPCRAVCRVRMFIRVLWLCVRFLLVIPAAVAAALEAKEAHVLSVYTRINTGACVCLCF